MPKELRTDAVAQSERMIQDILEPGCEREDALALARALQRILSSNKDDDIPCAHVIHRLAQVITMFIADDFSGDGKAFARKQLKIALQELRSE